MATSPQERLKEQVSSSVKESVERTTSILSNLHRVHSYLDILSNMTSPRASYVLKNALDQIKDIRTDAASLLQTVYLAEIGIQSLQDIDKGGVVNSTPFTTGIMPMLDSSGGDEGSERRLTHNHEGAEDVSEIVASLSNASNVNFGTPESLGGPATKKQKLSGEVSITACAACGKKFANQAASPDHAFCRTCRVSPVKKVMVSLGSHTPSIMTDASNDESAFASPRSVKSSSRGYLNRMKCTLCGVSFLYRRCLHRHIRENHSSVDLNNLEQYIQVKQPSSEPPSSSSSSEHSISATPTLINSSASSFVSQLQDTPQTISTSPHILLSVPTGDNYTVTPLSHDTMPNSNDSPRIGELESESQVSNGGLTRKYVCPTCGKSFDRQYRLQRHLQIHNPNRPKVNCPMCDKFFTRMDTLENHIKCLHTDERPYKCDFAGCNKSFPLQSSLIHHHKVHMDGKPYKCNECEASFALLGEFRSHLSDIHANTKDLRCSECYKVFPSSADLTQHVKDEHRLECEVCMRTFSRLSHLQSHIEVHKGDSLFNCRLCSAGFSSEPSYKKHLRTHSRVVTKIKSSHPCTICEKSFGEVDLLMEHYRSEEHRERVQAMGLEGTSILHTIEGGELSPEIRSLVDEVTGSIGATEVDERLMEGIQREGAMTVSIDDGGSVPYTVQVTGDPNMCGDQD